jgi:hypothetical protein
LSNVVVLHLPVESGNENQFVYEAVPKPPKRIEKARERRTELAVMVRIHECARDGNFFTGIYVFVKAGSA